MAEVLVTSVGKSTIRCIAEWVDDLSDIADWALTEDCIGENVKHGNLLCPICRCKWKEIPFQFATDDVTIVRRIRVLHRVNHSRPLPTVYLPVGNRVRESKPSAPNL
ncbi:hypothetical protein H5410_005823 [Solanum commersonii]|uniref:Uncharacterized protein n=1 Tax=Solanum commersonii TaxID=4109 RepID=A0A9J6A7N7_SOLCO|nr:hypothetical protein H5410_005823 [Solanum commersonii]